MEQYRPENVPEQQRIRCCVRRASGCSSERQELVDARAGLTTPPNTWACEAVAHEAQGSGAVGPSRAINGVDDDPNGWAVPLTAKTLEYGPAQSSPAIPKAWSDHYVNMDPKNPAGIVDMDQGFVWNNRQQMVTAMFGEQNHGVTIGVPG
ncbi:MAG: hypothetical protein R3B70_46565 [Polyangiaceae bacterium]